MKPSSITNSRKLSTAITFAAAVLALAPAILHAAAFTAGNLVVYRIGTGAAALNNAATAAFLDEYTTTGTYVQTIALPTAVAASGNRAMTASGTATTEGQITLSTDGQYISCVGYNAALATAAVASTPNNGNVADVSRVIGRVDAAGNVDSSTALIGVTGTPIYSGNNIRDAVIAGSAVYSCGSSAPLVGYSTFGGNTAAPLITSGSGRVINVFNGDLYYSTSATLQKFTGLPTGTATPTPLVTGLANASGFALVDVGNTGSPNACYLVDGGTLRKYGVSGATLTAQGTATITGSGSTISGVTAKVSGTSVTLYISSAAKIETLTDSSGAAGTLSGTATALTLTGSPVILGANAAFRGIAFAPVASGPVATAPPAVITNSAPGQVAITFYGWSNTAYVVQTTTNILGPWVPFSTNEAQPVGTWNNGSWIVTDSNATNDQQYYRLIIKP